MDNIKEIIHQVISQIADKKPDEVNKIDRVWQNILDKEDLKHTKLVGERQGKLSVVVDSPAWLYQMNLNKSKILKRIKDEIPNIKYISFRIGKVK